MSISKTAFERDLHAVHNRAELGRIFTALCEQVAQDLQRKGYAGRTMSRSLRYADFHGKARPDHCPGHARRRHAARRGGPVCTDAVAQQRLRLLGVRGLRWCRWPRRLCTLPLLTPGPAQEGSRGC